MNFKPRSESTRQFIIETTALLFNKKGYAGTSMSDIEEATKLTKGSIYGNFENKEEVALAVFDFNLSIVTARMVNQVAQAKNNKEKLLAYVTLYSSPANDFVFQTGGCPLLNTGIESDDTNDLLRQRVEAALIGWKNKLMAIVNEGIEAKEFKEVDANKVALSLIALIQGGVFFAKATNDIRNLDIAMESAKDIVNEIGAV